MCIIEKSVHDGTILIFKTDTSKQLVLNNIYIGIGYVVCAVIFAPV